MQFVLERASHFCCGTLNRYPLWLSAQGQRVGQHGVALSLNHSSKERFVLQFFYSKKLEAQNEYLFIYLFIWVIFGPTLPNHPKLSTIRVKHFSIKIQGPTRAAFRMRDSLYVPADLFLVGSAINVWVKRYSYGEWIESRWWRLNKSKLLFSTFPDWERHLPKLSGLFCSSEQLFQNSVQSDDDERRMEVERKRLSLSHCVAAALEGHKVPKLCE